MTMPTFAFAAALALATALSVGQQTQTPVCGLLAAEDVQAVAGGAPGTPVRTIPGKIATGPATGKLIRLCSWPVAATRSEVHVTMVGPLDSAGQAATVLTLGDEVRRLHRSGLAEEVKDVGGIHCSILTPGKATKPPRISTCMGAAKDVALLVDMRSQTKALTLDEAKHLFDQAAARLR